ncbi:hypothetical protein PQX77_005955 [Marasmius sp. AFHP31]|nr:hypothetical protein PQX77_005955 [Marasmius sp. AFHP31]
MSLEYRLTSYFRSKPPSKLDFDRFDTKISHVFETLDKAANALVYSPTSALPAVRSLDKHWSSVWPWMRALARALIDNPLPSTPKGVVYAQQFPAIASVILIYPIYNSACSESGELQGELDPIVKSAPDVLALTIELWLYAQEMDLGRATDALLHACGLFLQTHTPFMTLNNRKIEGKVLESLETMVRSSQTRWNPVKSFVKGLQQEASRHELKFNTIRYTFMYMNMLTSSTDILSVHVLCVEGGIRWACTLLDRLSSCYRPGGGKDSLAYFDEKAQCMVEFMAFFHKFIFIDAYFALPMLDGGVLVSVLKAKDLLIEDSKSGAASTSIGVAFQFSSWLKFLTLTCLHRPMFVRVVRSFKKIKAMGLSTDDDYFDICGAFKPSWLDLQEEVSKRRSGITPSIENCAPIRVCGNPQISATNRLDCYAVQDASRRYIVHIMINTSEVSTVICTPPSPDAKLNLVFHERKAGLCPRKPGQLEAAFMRQQFLTEFHTPPMKASVIQAFRRFTSEHLFDTKQPVIWGDYTTLLLSVEAVSVEESERRLSGEKGAQIMDSEVVGPESGGLAAIAKVTWRRQGQQTMLVGVVIPRNQWIAV